VNADEIAFVLAVQHIFRARRNKDTLKEQFAAGDLNGKKFRMSIDRYTAIMAALSVNWNTLAPLINEAFLFGLSPTTEMVVDEAIYRFFSTFHDPKPGKKKPSPQRFIPRKPNPNGLQALLGAVKINGIPYITCLIPDSDATNPLQIRDALAFAAAEFKRVFGFYPHIVADAGFSGQDLLKFLTSNFLFFALVYFIYFILFYFILFYFILFYFISFYFILFYFILFILFLFYFYFIFILF